MYETYNTSYLYKRSDPPPRDRADTFLPNAFLTVEKCADLGISPSSELTEAIQRASAPKERLTREDVVWLISRDFPKESLPHDLFDSDIAQRLAGIGAINSVPPLLLCDAFNHVPKADHRKAVEREIYTLSKYDLTALVAEFPWMACVEFERDTAIFNAYKSVVRSVYADRLDVPSTVYTFPWERLFSFARYTLTGKREDDVVISI